MQKNCTSKRESHGESERHFILGGRNNLARPDKGSMEVKTLGWLEALA
jgi:hypothetical protein